MGRNRAEASTTNTLGLLNQWCFVAGCLFLSPLCLFVSLLCPYYAIFYLCPVVFCSVVPFRGVTTDVREHTGGIDCSSRAQRWRCCTCRTGTQYRGFTVKHTVSGCSPGPGDLFFFFFFFLDCRPKSEPAELNPYPSDTVPHPLFLLSVGPGIVGPLCGEALVKWAIIPVGESDDDFWQSAAAARCQTIRAVAISSHGRTRTHGHARRLTPQTSCFSLKAGKHNRYEYDGERRGGDGAGRDGGDEEIRE